MPKNTTILKVFSKQKCSQLENLGDDSRFPGFPVAGFLDNMYGGSVYDEDDN
jgi:hypothetical protein